VVARKLRRMNTRRRRRRRRRKGYTNAVHAKHKV
jgi:hypothetical protein